MKIRKNIKILIYRYTFIARNKKVPICANHQQCDLFRVDSHSLLSINAKFRRTQQCPLGVTYDIYTIEYRNC